MNRVVEKNVYVGGWNWWNTSRNSSKMSHFRPILSTSCMLLLSKIVEKNDGFASYISRASLWELDRFALKNDEFDIYISRSTIQKIRSLKSEIDPKISPEIDPKGTCFVL